MLCWEFPKAPSWGHYCLLGISMMWLNKFLQLAQYHSISADDIALYCSIRSSADYPLLLQADITAIASCVEEEKHLNFFNTNKCSLMLIFCKHTLSITPPPPGIAVEQADSVKHLGVLLSLE